ncbi:MAG: hypothetical protein WA431_06485 [Candidatus Cybelea sp.]
MDRDDDELIGRIGQTNSAIEQGKRGEVLLPFKGGFETYLAYADQPIAKGVRVTVLDVLPGRTVRVAPTTIAADAPRVAIAPAAPPGSHLMARPEPKGTP